MGSVVRRVRKIIPKEVRPAVPFVASYFGGPALGKALGIKGQLARNLTGKALTAALASKAQGDDTDIALRSAALAAAPDLIQSGLGSVGAKLTPQTTEALKASLPVTGGGSAVPLSQQLGSLATAASESDLMTSLVSPKGQTLGAQAKALAIPTAIEGSAQLAEIQQDQLDEYNRQLREQGIINKVKRRQGIFDIYMNAGYDEDYVNSVLDKYGYAEGGIIEQLEELRRRMRAPEPLAKAMSKKGRFRTQKDKKNKKTVVAEPDEKDEITVNIQGSEGDDGFLQSLQTAREGIEMAYRPPIGSVQAVPMMKFANGGDVKEEGIMTMIVDSMGDDYDNFLKIKIKEKLQQMEDKDTNMTVDDAADLAEQEAMGMVIEKYGFATGGEVEIEEETDDLGIMDLMKDQGIEYGEQVSAPGPKDGYDDIARQLFGKGYKDLTPEELEMFQEELERLMNKFRSGMNDEGIMKMASGYKTDIEEMYEQYVFEMEEQGLTPMSFADFLRQARAGMKDGGITFEEYLEGRGKEEKMQDRQKLLDDYEEFLRRQKVREQKQEAKDGGILKAANGGTPGARYSFLINKQKQGILSPDEEEELLMLEMTFADESQGKADGGIMEKDMRGGGFIPEGSKERADDVPARLSKNEFVMTADAVRAAGGGSINKGAKRMYDMMYSLEGKI